MVGDEGLEPVVPENAVTVLDRIELRHAEQVVAESGGAESGAVGTENEVVSIPDDPRLLGLIDAWPTLPEDTRDEIARLAGLHPDDLRDMTATSAGKAVSR